MEARAQLDGPDAALVAQVARGDVAAFNALYGRYAREVFVLAAHTIGPADAEEVVQDVFVRLWRHAEQFDPRRGSFPAWLMTIARNLVIDNLKRRRGGPAAAEAVDELLAGTADPTVDVEEEAALAERRTAVVDALRALPEDQRRALVLAYFGGLSQAAIASRLGWPLGTVKKRVRLGLEKLQASLASASAVEDTERPAASR